MSAQQDINDKLQGSVAAHLRCGGVVNNQIKKGLLLSLWVKKIKIGEYLAKLQARAWLSRALCTPGQNTAHPVFVLVSRVPVIYHKCFFKFSYPHNQQLAQLT